MAQSQPEVATARLHNDGILLGQQHTKIPTLVKAGKHTQKTQVRQITPHMVVVSGKKYHYHTYGRVLQHSTRRLG